MQKASLEPMDQEQFERFMDAILPPYAEERAAADYVDVQVAEQFARTQHAQLLPAGHLTAGHHFLRIMSPANEAEVGGVWFWIDEENKQAFLYNIAVYPSFRRRGLASQALALIEQRVRAAGCNTLGLNVFSTNEGAIALYGKAGFQMVTSYWNKKL